MNWIKLLGLSPKLLVSKFIFRVYKEGSPWNISPRCNVGYIPKLLTERLKSNIDKVVLPFKASLIYYNICDWLPKELHYKFKFKDFRLFKIFNPYPRYFILFRFSPILLCYKFSFKFYKDYSKPLNISIRYFMLCELFPKSFNSKFISN